MNIAKIKYCSIGNWKGISTSLYVSGCCHRCKGCFQPETWNPNYGHKWEEIDKQMIIDSLHPEHITGLVLLGGEPFMQYNIPELVQLCKEVRTTHGNSVEIVAFTGFTFDNMLCDPLQLELIKQLDVLIDGKFEQELYSPKLNFRGSLNQRIIDVQESLRQNKVILHKLNNNV